MPSRSERSARLAEWRRLLRASTTQGRAVLQRVLRGRIVFTPSGKGYTFQAPTRFDKLFGGIAAPRPAFIERSNRGAEHIGLEDMFDADYGRLLERATAPFVDSGKWGSSLPPASWNQIDKWLRQMDALRQGNATR